MQMPSSSASPSSRQPMRTKNGHSGQYSQMIAITIKALVWVMNCEFLNRDKGSLRVLYRSTLMVNRLKIEMGIVIMYTTCQTMQNALPWFHAPSRKSDSISNGTTIVAARKSERAKEKMKRFVGLLRRCRLASIAKQTKKFPKTATTVITM